MIYTGYYAKYKGQSGICISNSHPTHPDFTQTLPQLYPDWVMVKAFKSGEITWQQFRKAYIKKLKKLDVHKMATLCEGQVLLCYEKDRTYCHRSIVSEWFNRNGYTCEEVKECTQQLILKQQD